MQNHSTRSTLSWLNAPTPRAKSAPSTYFPHPRAHQKNAGHISPAAYGRLFRARNIPSCGNIGYLLGMSMKKIILALALIALPIMALASGNTTNDSFNTGKRMLERQVYFDHRA